jgi:hypothetical protein
MVLLRKKFGNGYGCACCSESTYNVKWIEKKEMKSVSQLLDMLYNEDSEEYWHADRDSTILEIIYEEDGKLLYGYHIDYFAKREDVYFFYGNEKYKVLESFNKQGGGYSREELENLLPKGAL